MLFDPAVMDLCSHRSTQSQTAGFVGEDPHDVRTTLQFLVHSLEHVRALEVFLIAQWQAQKGQRSLDLILDPSAQPRFALRPFSQPGPECQACRL